MIPASINGLEMIFLKDLLLLMNLLAEISSVPTKIA